MAAELPLKTAEHPHPPATSNMSATDSNVTDHTASAVTMGRSAANSPAGTYTIPYAHTTHVSSSKWSTDHHAIKGSPAAMLNAAASLSTTAGATATSYSTQQQQQRSSAASASYQQQFEIQKSQALQNYHAQQQQHQSYEMQQRSQQQQEAVNKSMAQFQKQQVDRQSYDMQRLAATQRQASATEINYQQQYEMQKAQMMAEASGRSASYQKQYDAMSSTSNAHRMYHNNATTTLGQAGVVISENRYVDHEHTHILNERIVEHEVRVPKRITREDVVEKVIVIPERVLHEETVEDVQTIREKIIEIAKPIIQERIVEVPEIEIVERIVEVPEIVYQEKIVERAQVVIEERIIEVPKIIIQEKIVEVPEIEYREVPVERIVEVPEIREQVVIKEIPVPQYVKKPVAEYVDVHEEREVVRTVPVPVEAVTTCEFKLPRLRPRYTQVDVPLYVPRFVEVPVALDAMDAGAVAQAETFSQQVSYLASQAAVSLCEVESLAHNIKSTNFEEMIGAQDHANTITEQWMSGKLQVDPTSMSYTTSSTTAVDNIALSETIYHGNPIITQITQETVDAARAACEAQIAASKKMETTTTAVDNIVHSETMYHSNPVITQITQGTMEAAQRESSSSKKVETTTTAMENMAISEGAYPTITQITQETMEASTRGASASHMAASKKVETTTIHRGQVAHLGVSSAPSQQTYSSQMVTQETSSAMGGPMSQPIIRTTVLPVQQSRLSFSNTQPIVSM